MLANLTQDCLSTGWVVVKTHPQRERCAMEHLERQDFTAYCPMLASDAHQGSKRVHALRPLFPSYLFVQLSRNAVIWRPILSTRGVRRVLGCDQRLSFVDDRFIRSLKSREIEGAVVRPLEPYQVGQRVYMNGGALDGLVATVLELGEKDRIVLLLKLLNRPVTVATDLRHVKEFD